MLKSMPTLLLALCLIGCNEKPYREPTKPQEAEYSFSGITDIGTPISGATVSAYKFSKLTQGEKISEAITALDGSFNLQIKTDYDGPVLLKTAGGLYRDLVRNETIALKPDQELKSVITHIKMPEKTNINAWTTLAVARVQADRGFWDKSVAELKDVERISVDFSHMSYFLSGKDPNYVNISRQEPFDASKDSFKLEDPRVTLYLAHGGLSRLASDYSARLVQDGVIIGVMDLVAALADDLSDRVFDGRNAAGNVVFVGKKRRISLDSYTMRKALSEAIMLYSSYLEKQGKITAEDTSSLEKPGKLVHAITWQVQPELFPQAEAPRPLDKESPIVRVNFAGQNSHEQLFAYLDGPVIFEVIAEDDSYVSELRMLEPSGPQYLGNRFGPILDAQKPQARNAALACGKEAQLDAEIKRLQLAEANIVCACFEAKDVMGNTTKELGCFQREEFKTTIDFPTPNMVLGAKSFEEGVKLKALVSSGLSLTECFWSIKSNAGGENAGGEVDVGILPSGKGVTDGTKCVIEAAMDGSKLFNGTYYLELTAKDIGGRVLNNDNRDIQTVVHFQVAKDPPEVQIIKPALSGYVDMEFIEVAGKVLNPDIVANIEYKIRGLDEKNEGSKASSRAIIDEKTGNWYGTVNQNMPAGRYTLDLVITDIYGNQKNLEPHFFTLDFEEPTIMGAGEGVLQTPYLQETMNYNQRFIDDPKNPRYIVEPAGAALPISWSRGPTIQRWSTRLDDARNAPIYTFRAKDDNKIKELRYSLGSTCSSLKESFRVATLLEDRYDIPFIQSNADVDLSRDSVKNSSNQKYCLSIWAIDQAGHATNHTVEFNWKVIAPPVSIDMNSSRYKSNRSDDDITSINKVNSMIILEGKHLRLGGNIVVGHAIITNPHAIPVSTLLALKKPMYFKLNEHAYYIPQNMIQIKYFAYDLAQNKVGSEITRMDGSIMLKTDEAVLAKFVLFQYPERKANFWQNLRMEVGFNKPEMDKPIIDGLLLAMRDISTTRVLGEFSVSWGDNHHLRKRKSTRSGA